MAGMQDTHWAALGSMALIKGQWLIKALRLRTDCLAHISQYSASFSKWLSITFFVLNTVDMV